MSVRRFSSHRVRAVLLLVAVVAAMLASPAVAAGATPGAPAPIRMLPICQQLQDPPIGACPAQSDYLTMSSSGSFDGSGAVVATITPSIPPCATYSFPTDSYSPSTCYTQIVITGRNQLFGSPHCEYLDDATGLLEPCLAPYQDSFAQWDDSISLSGDWRYQYFLESFGCASVSAFQLYYEGGPSGSGQTWPELAAETGECVMTMDRTPDNLMGASWVIISGYLQVARPGDDGSVLELAYAETYVGVNGTLGPFAEVEDPDPEPEPDPDPEPPTPFTDVADSSFAYDDITLLYELEITNGVSATAYGPEREVTREQMAAFLARVWRALGNDCPDGENPFVDISTSSYAYAEAACIFGLGITTGVSATEYDPSGKLTREQMAAFLARMWRALGNECPLGLTPFTDVASSSFAAADIACIYLLGITTGTSATTYGPSEDVTREQMAAFLGRLYRAQSS